MPSITHIKCDYKKDGKLCGNSVFLHENPAHNAPNVADVVRSTDAYGQTLYFCCPLHLICHWTDELKKQAAQKVQDTESKAHKAVEELEGLSKIPPPPDDLTLN